MFCRFWVENVHGATAACNFLTWYREKLSRTPQFFNILTYTCASRHSGVQFFPIATSKMAPRMRCFVHFDLQMCFAPQRCAIFPDRNFQNGSGAEVFCTFWLTNVLRATAACNFSKLLAAKASAPAALPRLLFEQQEARILEKTQRFATFLTFLAHLTVTWLDRSRDMTWLWHSLWQLSILSEVRLLNFLR